MVFVLECDGDLTKSFLAGIVAVSNLIQPIVKGRRADNAALKRDIRGLVQAGDFADAVLHVVAVAVFGNSDFHADVAALLEPGIGTRTDTEIDQEIELHKG